MSVRRRKWRGRKTGADKEVWVVDVKYQLPTGVTIRVRKTSPVPTKRGAEEYERQLRQSLLDGTFGKETKEPTPTLREFVPKFLTHADNNNKPSTAAAKRQLLNDHVLPKLGKKRLDEISALDVEGFKAVMLKKVSRATHRRVRLS